MSDETTRTRILSAAGETFAERGFEKTTIREICRLAEVNLASVNYHFGDKDRLYVEAIKHAHRMRVAQAPLPVWSPGTPPETRLRDFVQTTLTWMLMEGQPWQHQLMVREMTRPSGACREMVEDFIRPHFKLLLSILAELAPHDAPPHRLHQLGFSVIGQCLFYKFNREVIQMLIPEAERRRHFTLDHLAEHIASVVLAALDRQPKLFSKEN